MHARKWAPLALKYFGEIANFFEDTVESILLAVLSSVWRAASGFAALVAMLLLPISSITLFAPDTRKFNFIHSRVSGTPSLNVITVVQRMFSYSASFPQSRIPSLYYCAVNLVHPLRPRRI